MYCVFYYCLFTTIILPRQPSETVPPIGAPAYEDFHGDFDSLTFLSLFHVTFREYPFLRTQKMEVTFAKIVKFRSIQFIGNEGTAVFLRRIPLQCRKTKRWIFHYIKLTSSSNHPTSVCTTWFSGVTSHHGCVATTVWGVSSEQFIVNDRFRFQNKANT